MSDKKGIMRALRFQDKTTFNLNKLSDGRGVYHFTVRNVGTANLIIDDTTQEIIAPGETWVLESTVAIMNDLLKFKFSGDGIKDAIARFVIDFSC